MPTGIFVVRHGHVLNHLGDVTLKPEGRREALQAGIALAEHIADGESIAVCYSPSERTRETAEELARGLNLGLRVQGKMRARFVSLLETPAYGAYVLVTHSGPMRAFLRDVLGADPGEPHFCEWFRVDARSVYYRGTWRPQNLGA